MANSRLDLLRARYGHLYDCIEAVSDTVAYGHVPRSSFESDGYRYDVPERYQAYVFTRFAPPKPDSSPKYGWLSAGTFRTVEELSAKLC